MHTIILLQGIETRLFWRYTKSWARSENLALFPSFYLFYLFPIPWYSPSPILKFCPCHPKQITSTGKDLMQSSPLPTYLLLSPIHIFIFAFKLILSETLCFTDHKTGADTPGERARVALSNPQQLEFLKTSNELQCKSTVFSLKRCKHILLSFSWERRQNL